MKIEPKVTKTTTTHQVKCVQCGETDAYQAPDVGTLAEKMIDDGWEEREEGWICSMCADKEKGGLEVADEELDEARTQLYDSICDNDDIQETLRDAVNELVRNKGRNVEALDDEVDILRGRVRQAVYRDPEDTSSWLIDYYGDKDLLHVNGKPVTPKQITGGPRWVKLGKVGNRVLTLQIEEAE